MSATQYPQGAMGRVRTRLQDVASWMQIHKADALKLLLAMYMTVTLAAEHSHLPGAQPSWKGLCGLLVPFCGSQPGSSAALGLTGKQHAALQRHRFCVAPPPPEAVASLAAAAQAFLGMTDAEKEVWVDPQDAFHNYRLLTAGRECFVVRDGNLPEALRGPARAAWRYFMRRGRAALREIEARLGLPAARLTELLEGNDLPDYKSSSLLRCFLYPGTEHGGEILTLPHADLGLLSFCWQDVPGLELYAPELAGQRWLPTSARGELTILAGEALEVVSGRRMRPCTHRVVAAPATRHSVVFHLRMRRDALLDSARLRHPPHLPRLQLTVSDFVAQQTVRRPSRNQPVQACKRRGERSASKIGDSCGAAAEGSRGQKQELFLTSQSRDSHGKESPEQAECLSREPGVQTVRQPLDVSAMDAAVRSPQTQGAPSSIPEHK